MSNYNSQLQSNNTDLQTVLQTLQTKAAGAVLPELTNEGIASDLLSGKQLINSDGNIVEGIIPIQTKLNYSIDTVTAYAGYYPNDTIYEIKDGYLRGATTINIDDTGIVTLTDEREMSGRLPDTISLSAQLPIQDAQTITPGTANQIISSGKYLIGDQVIEGDANLVAENIKSGVSIFGVSGTLDGDSGTDNGDYGMENGLISGTITHYENNRVTAIGDYIFYNNQNLTSVSFSECITIGVEAFRTSAIEFANFPKCEEIGFEAFADCGTLLEINCPKCINIGVGSFLSTSLSSINFPECTHIDTSAFAYSSLESIHIPKCTYIGTGAFSYNSLESINLPACTMLLDCAFDSCSRLTAITLGASEVCYLHDIDAFNDTGITPTTGFIYVPASLVNAYKSATNWIYFKDRIFAIEGEDGSI